MRNPGFWRRTSGTPPHVRVTNHVAALCLTLTAIAAPPAATRAAAQTQTPSTSATTQPPAPLDTHKDRLTLAQYLDYETVSDAQLSPDAHRVVYTRRFVDKMSDKWETALWMVDANGMRDRFLASGSAARWSPDGTRLAYIAKGEPNNSAQIFVRYMDADGATTQITRVDQTPADIAWSPDGKSVAFRMLVSGREPWKIDMPTPPKGAKWTEPPHIVTRLKYRADRQGYVDDGYRHIFIVTADGGTPRQLTAGNSDHGAPEWTPDGRSILFDGNLEPDAEYAWRESEVYAADVSTGGVRRLTNHKGPDANPTASPDGRLIAYTSFDSTDATWVDSKLNVMNADGSNPRSLTTALDRTPQGLMWAPDGSGVYFNVDNEGTRNLYFAPLSGGARRVTDGRHILTVSNIVKNGEAAAVSTAPNSPPDVYVLNVRSPAQLHQLTQVNADIMAGRTLGQVEEIRYPSSDGLTIQGWLVKPPDFDPHRKYPLILEIHGGPHAMYGVGFNYSYQNHASNEYVVLYTNPRGSTGYGSAFGNAIKNAYPGNDYNDLMTGVDSVIARGYIDPAKLFVYGCSGGGVLTSWTVGHTNRFAAAAVLCPVIDWISFVGTTDGPSWYYNFAKLPWVDPSEHLRRSPLMYVGNVTTPTMLMTGVNDLRTPISQTEEFYEALKMRRVPTAMVRFNNEWHGTSSTPSNFIRTQLYLESWFNRWGNSPRPQGSVTSR